MKRTIFYLLVIIIIAAVICSLLITSGKDDLWTKAVLLAEDSWSVIPGKITVTTETISENEGMASSPSTETFLYSLNENGDIISERIIEEPDFVQRETTLNTGQRMVMSLDMLHDGTHDLTNLEGIPDLEGLNLADLQNVQVMTMTAEQFKNFSSGQIPDNMSSHKTHQSSIIDVTPKREGLFFETDNRFLKVRRLSGTKNIDGITTKGYSFTYTPTGLKKDREKGRIWLELETGYPVLKETGSGKNTTQTYYSFNETTNQFFIDKTISTNEINIPFVSVNMTLINKRVYEDYITMANK